MKPPAVDAAAIVKQLAAPAGRDAPDFDALDINVNAAFGVKLGVRS